MKKLILLAVLCAVHCAAYAQAGSLSVTNTTTCDVFMEVFGDVNTGCGTSYVSSFITIPALTTTAITYSDPTAVPGGMNCGTCTPTSLGSTDYITMVRVQKGVPGCGTPNYKDLGEPCVPLPTTWTYMVTDASTCNACGITNVTYTPAATPGGAASIAFY